MWWIRWAMSSVWPRNSTRTLTGRSKRMKNVWSSPPNLLSSKTSAIIWRKSSTKLSIRSNSKEKGKNKYWRISRCFSRIFSKKPNKFTSIESRQRANKNKWASLKQMICLSWLKGGRYLKNTQFQRLKTPTYPTSPIKWKQRNKVLGTWAHRK